ncbi:MAG: hypothetical protein FJ202_11580 [Gemmatimonadetes bacterium]|nr:hypothetical protein [Gemmatimonadota bacterium]
MARAPTRIDLGGGWTDVPPYPEEQGGFVCNIAIARYATVSVETAPRGEPVDSPLTAAVLRRFNASDVHVTIENEFPVGAGLGGSSSACAALVTALAARRGETLEPADLAELGRRIEVDDLGIAGGRQDHYAAAFGGALALTFGHEVRVERIRISGATKSEFERRALLVFTGESRISGRTVAAVINAYRRGDRAVCAALDEMKALAIQMPAALSAGDLDLLGELVAAHWEHQRSLHPEIPTPRIDEIIEAARRSGAVGWKAMGASGGGCVLVIAGAGREAAVRAAVTPLGDLIEVRIAEQGAAYLPPDQS